MGVIKEERLKQLWQKIKDTFVIKGECDPAGSATQALQDAKVYTDDIIQAADFATKQWVAERVGENALRKQVVTSLPTAGIDVDTIYLILKPDTSGNDNYNEYINLTGTSAGWEFLGNTSAQLGDYYNKTDSNNLFLLKIGDSSDTTNAFTPAGILSALTSGEKLSISLGKIAKVITDFITHKSDTSSHLTNGRASAADRLANAVDLTSNFNTADYRALPGAASGAIIPYHASYVAASLNPFGAESSLSGYITYAGNVAVSDLTVNMIAYQASNNTARFAMRTNHRSTGWGAWHTFLDSRNVSAYALSVNGGAVEGKAYFHQGTMARTLNNIYDGKDGYAHVIKIVINAGYIDQPVTLEVLQRNRTGRIVVHFKGSSSFDPDLQSFTVAGSIKAYIVKSATGTWDLYIQKSQGYEKIEILELNKGNYMDGVALEWKDATVAVLPAGYVTATLENLLLNISGNAATVTNITTATADFTQAADVNAIASGEPVSAIFGKLAKLDRDYIDNYAGYKIISEGSGSSIKYYIQKGPDATTKKLIAG